jgi:hypothetical protein
MPQDRNGGGGAPDVMDASPGRTRHHRIAQEQAALRRVAMLVAGGAPPEEVFSAVAEEAGRLLEVDFATLVRYDPQDAITVAGAWTRTGAPPKIPVGSRLPLGGRNLATLVYQTGRPQRIDYDDVSGTIGDTAGRDWGPPLVGGRADPGRGAAVGRHVCGVYPRGVAAGGR